MTKKSAIPKEDEMPSCYFLVHALIKQLNCLSIANSKNMIYMDMGSVFSLAYRSFDLLFHASVQQNFNGHILKEDNKFYSLENFQQDAKYLIDPTTGARQQEKQKTDRVLDVKPKCNNSCNKCETCNQCIKHKQLSKCDCTKHYLFIKCKKCNGYDHEDDHCRRCLYPLFNHNKDILKLNGIDPYSLHSHLSLLVYDSWKSSTNFSLDFIGNDLAIIINTMYKLRNEDQHGLSYLVINMDKKSNDLKFLKAVVQDQGLYFYSIYESILKDYYNSDTKKYVCGTHRESKISENCYFSQLTSRQHKSNAKKILNYVDKFQKRDLEEIYKTNPSETLNALDNRLKKTISNSVEQRSKLIQKMTSTQSTEPDRLSWKKFDDVCKRARNVDINFEKDILHSQLLEINERIQADQLIMGGKNILWVHINLVNLFFSKE